MKLTVRLESYALCGSGEGAGLIDSDIVHDRHGIPYLPGRRLKGLLRESALEVTEMLGMASPVLVNHVFGSDGFQPGIVKAPNLYPLGYDTTWAAVLPKLLEAKDNTLLTPAAILSDFSSIRQQTAIDQDGVARDASLRIGRMLKPGVVFEGDLIIADQDRPVSALLWLAVRNLRRFGTRRNRGQGTISCTLSSTVTWSVQHAIDEVRKWSAPGIPGPSAAIEKTPAENDTPARLMMTIRTMSPVVLAVQTGEQNTVNTAPCIPGSTVKGILVDRVYGALGLQKGKEHESAQFRTLFLEAGVSSLFASPAFPFMNNALYTPAPLYLHRDKVPGLRLHNLLASQPTNTKPVRGLLSLTSNGNGEKEYVNNEPDTTLFFHTQRAQDRKQGKSSDDDGAIFYYEAIEKGQEFRATLQGPEGLLDLILSIGDFFSASIGRSRSAQYGQVQVTLSRPPADEKDDEGLCSGDETVLTCLSPLIVRNHLGFPEASASNLALCLREALGKPGVAVEAVSSYARTTIIDPFISVMGCRLPGCEAFREGSSFVVKVTGMSSEEFSQRLRKIASTGLGEWRAMGFGAAKFSEPPMNSSLSARSDVRSAHPLASVSPFPAGLNDIIVRIVQRELRVALTEHGMKDAKEFFSDNPQKRLNNHQIGRLETFVTNAGDLAGLRAKLAELRENAEKKLKACQTNARISIHEELTSFTEPVQKHLNRFWTNHEKLLQAVDIAAPIGDDVFRLAQCYWLTLLRRLRKLNKEAK